MESVPLSLNRLNHLDGEPITDAGEALASVLSARQKNAALLRSVMTTVWPRAK